MTARVCWGGGGGPFPSYRAQNRPRGERAPRAVISCLGGDGGRMPPIILQILQLVLELGLKGFFGRLLWNFFATIKGIFSLRIYKFLFEVYFFLMETRVSTKFSQLAVDKNIKCSFNHPLITLI